MIFNNHRMITVIEGVGSAALLATPAAILTGALASYAGAQGATEQAISVWAVTMAVGGTYIVGKVIEARALNSGPSVVYKVNVNERRFPELDREDNPIERKYHAELSPVMKRRIAHNAVNPPIPQQIAVTQMQRLAGAVLLDNEPMTFAHWAGGGKTFARSQWETLRAYLYEKDLATNRGRAQNNGIELTEAGQRWMKNIYDVYGPAPQKTRRVEKLY
jgi:hypothetical protein